MRNQVLVLLDKGVEFQFNVTQPSPMSHEAARVWLDEQFTRLDCEPLRASGKVLLADKVLTVARAAGVALMQDPTWSRDFARAASAAPPHGPWARRPPDQNGIPGLRPA